MKKWCFAFLCLMGVLAGSYRGTAGEPVAPKGWADDTDFAETEDMFRTALEGENGIVPQQTMNRYLKMIAAMEDARLFIIYTRLYEALDGKERTKLCAEQALWIKLREKSANEEAQTDAGGSAEISDYWGGYYNATKRRQKELQGRLAALGKGKKQAAVSASATPHSRVK